MAGSNKISGLPIRARLCWLVSWRLTEAGPNQLKISRKETGENRRVIDVWPVRERFLALGTWEQACDFFAEFGPFRRAPEEVNREQPSQEEITTVDFATVKSHQLLFKEFMEDEEWYSDKPVIFDNKALSTGDVARLSRIFRGAVLKGYPSPHFTLKPDGYAPIKKEQVPSPYLDYEAPDVYGAVYASIYIDKMRGLRGRVCEREGCTNTFLTTDPRKRFCDLGKGACSARVRVQKRRIAERIAKAKNVQSSKEKPISVREAKVAQRKKRKKQGRV